MTSVAGARGVLDAFFAALGAEADLEWPVIDSTVVRAPARGRRPREQRGPQTQGLGRSRGGLSTEVHAAAAASDLQRTRVNTRFLSRTCAGHDRPLHA